MTALLVFMIAWAFDVFSVRSFNLGAYVALAGATGMGYWLCEYGIPEGGHRKTAYPFIAALIALAWLAVTVWLGALSAMRSFPTAFALFALIAPVSFTVREYTVKSSS